MHHPSDWLTQARCRTDGYPDMFYAESTGATRIRRIAKQICRECPVRTECLTEAVRHQERYGIWAGYDMGNPDQRRQARHALETA